MNRCVRMLAAAAALLLMLAGWAVSSVGAQSSATIDIVASIGVTPTLSVSVCDSSVSFGSGLTSEGAEPVGADSGVFPTSPGTEPGEGAFYVWESECSPTLFFSSNVPYTGAICATENTAESASPDVQVSQGDLLFLTEHGAPPTYKFWSLDRTVESVPVDCSGGGRAFVFSPPGDRAIDLSLALHVDDGDAGGNFSSRALLSVFAQ